MVTRRRLRSFLTALCLYAVAAALIGYFGINAFTGNRGLRAKQDIERQVAELTAEIQRVRAERDQWERRVSLLRSGNLDPDMLDERARAVLNYSHANDAVLLLRSR
jgi:cell division protein FtsB